MEAQAIPPRPSPGTSRERGRRDRTPPRRLWADRAAAWCVTAGGMITIACILGILFFIALEVTPLMSGAGVTRSHELDLRSVTPGAVVSDEYRSHTALLTADGEIRIVNLDSGAVVHRQDLVTSKEEEAAAEIVATRPVPGEPLLTAATADGRIAAVRIDWEVSFDGDRRVVEGRVADPVLFEMDPDGQPVGPFSARVDDEGTAMAVALLSDGTLAAQIREVDINMFTEELTESWSRVEFPLPETPTVLLLDAERSNLYAGTASGRLIWWRIRAGRPGEPHVVETGSPGISEMSLLIGDRSLVVGHEDGTLAVWFPVRQPDESFVLTRIREFPAHPGPIRRLAPSLRNKGFLAQDDSGRLGLYYSTSHRVLWEGPSPVPAATALFYTPKADGALVAGAGTLSMLDIDNPHPEISFGSLFGKIWYEGYTEPRHVWQSTGGTDDFEPKLSLTPLLIGTLKGTLYSLILAIPLGVFGAMYTSQFVHPTLKRYIKPTVEIMAALPSVVLGFLAGLWLAPRVERVLPALALMFVVVPLFVLTTGYLWRLLPASVRHRFAAGSETLLYMVVVSIAIWLCVRIGPALELAAFGGDFQAWLLDITGLRYDQRNAVVVGLAMGFAVIPIIFSIAEDAFSNVPRNLVSGSLALGANRWQTVIRVVLPTASPGIFSAVMIGFGRAVGETMIVLMATGNTPIMDWNPFNGFRTLSANIAVEIPEAPQGDTLYRTLFLAALLLFLLTFAVNTAGDLVRQRLRKKFAQL